MFLKEKEKPVLIWTYHRILPENGNASVSIDIFKKQIEYLKEKKYEFITTDELELWFENKLDPSKRYTMLTFDDGWADNYFYAQSILKEYNIKAVLALNTGLSNNNSEILRTDDEYIIYDSKAALYDSAYNIDKSSFLTKPEIIKMHQSGIWDVQSHGNSHFGSFQCFSNVRGFHPQSSHWTLRFALDEEPFEGAPRAEFLSTLCKPIGKVKKDFIDKLKTAEDNNERLEICRNFSSPVVFEDKKEFIKRITDDMQACRRWIKNNLEKESRSMFWPWGHYSTESVNVAKAAGFNMMFTMNKSALNKNLNPSEIPRIAAPDNLKRFIHQEKVFTSQFKTLIRNFFKNAKK